MNNKSLVGLISAALFSSHAFAQTVPFSVDHLTQLNKVHSAALSPDGHSIIYGLTTTSGQEKRSDLYLQDLAKSDAPLQLTNHSATERNVLFHPDGKSIYFLSARGGQSQVWQLPLTGGEAQQVTHFPQDINGFKLSRDGQKILITARLFPQCDTVSCSVEKEKSIAALKQDGREYDQLMVRHWDTWGDHKRNHLLVGQLEAGQFGAFINITQGQDTETPPLPFSGLEEASFSHDGQQIFFSAKAPSKSQAWHTNYDIWQVGSDGKGLTNLTIDNKAWDAHPVVSPDGRYLAYLAMKTPGFEADRFAVKLRDLVTGQIKELAPTWDRSASDIQFSKDGQTLFVTAQNVGQRSIFAINIQFGDVTTVVNEGYNSIAALSDEHLFYWHNDLANPNDLHQITHTGNNHRQLTQANEQKLSNVAFGDYEQFTFKGWNNEIVHGYWIKPVNFQAGKRYPIAYLVHGGPQGSFGNGFSGRWNAQLWAGAGYGVVMVDFHGSTGYGQAFTDSITQDWGGKPLEDLKKGLAAVTEQQPWLDASRACALGGSYGGYMMNWFQGHWSDGFNCLVNHAGLFDMRSMYYVTEELWFPEHEFGGQYHENRELYEKFNPVNYVQNWRTPMLVIHGEKDFRVPYGQGLAAFSYMQRNNIPSKLLMFPNENHWILNQDNLKQWYHNVFQWMDKWTNK